jgi:hypothetical protein
MANRLAAASSPYLLQHAHNPVHWHPWDAQALALARQRDVPIFLSIGYSTCYWCHVMERESFEDHAIAALLNDAFVCIKVDREERPDLDDAYMAAVQMITGHGGWPMTVFLDPHTLRPFWGGTYFPPRPARGMPSLPQLIERMSGAWAARRDEVLKQADAVAQAVSQKLASGQPPVRLEPGHAANAVQTLLTIVDRAEGGFGRAPKFPQPVYLELLLDARDKMTEPEHASAIDQALRTTLDAMATGGLFDHLAGGFHRYSVDAHWTVPHFEKMLYDNAQLLSVYARAATLLADPFYARVARKTAHYTLAEMTSRLPPPHAGGFFTAQDAEVDGREGQSYVWTLDQARLALQDLDPHHTQLALDALGLSAGPNFQDPHHPSEAPTNVLRLAERPDLTAARLGLSTDAFLTRLDDAASAMLALRATRKPPRLDDKVLTAWNGLMIGALAQAGALLNEPAFIRAALDAARFAQSHLIDASGHVLRCYRAPSQADTPAAQPVLGALEDYAMLAQGLIRLAGVLPMLDQPASPSAHANPQHHPQHHPRQDLQQSPLHWLELARTLCADALRRFRPEHATNPGDLFDALPQPGEPPLFVRARSTYDGALPTGASALLHALLDLASLHPHTPQDPASSDHNPWLTAAFRVLRSLSHAIDESPIATANATRALLRVMVTWPDQFEAFQAHADTQDPPHAAPGGLDPTSIVTVMASADHVSIEPDQPAQLTIRIDLAEGFHVNDAFAAQATGGTLIPLRVDTAGGTGLRVYADYPPGTPVEGAQHAIHKGSIQFNVVLERAGEWSGQPRLYVQLQPCDDRRCLAPLTIELDVEIEPAGQSGSTPFM